MTRLKAWLAATLAATTLAGTAGAAEWKRLDSEHFTLTARIGSAPATAYLRQLEAFRWLALKTLGADENSVRAKARFEILLLQGQDSLRSLYPQLPENVAGLYTYCDEGTLAVGTYQSGQRGQDFNQVVLQHEYAHHLMFQYATIGYPAWFVEGFAEYMATSAMDGDKATLGGMHEARYNTLRSGVWLPYDEVLRWHLRSRPPNEQESAFFYAQSWLLVHYMLSDGARTKKLADYHARVAAGADPVAAFEPATGIAVAELGALLRPYSYGVPMLVIAAEDLPRPRIETTPLGDDAEAYLPHAAALRSCVRPEHGKAVLEKLRAAARDNAGPGFRLALARAETRFGDTKAAMSLLDTLAVAEPQNAEAQYLLGRAWLRQADQLAGEEQAAAHDRARGYFFQAYRLRKDDAPTLYYLARALARKGVDSNALNAARAAHVMAPAVTDYAVLEARLDLATGDRERAARALGPLAGDPHRPQLAVRMRRAIDAIRAGKPADEVGALLNPEPEKPSP